MYACACVCVYIDNMSLFSPSAGNQRDTMPAVIPETFICLLTVKRFGAWNYKSMFSCLWIALSDGLSTPSQKYLKICCDKAIIKNLKRTVLFVIKNFFLNEIIKNFFRSHFL